MYLWSLMMVCILLVPSFQLYLFIDDVASFVVFSFTSCQSGLSLNANPSVYSSTIAISATITNICSYSNVGVAGVWVSEVYTFNTGIAIFDYLYDLGRSMAIKILVKASSNRRYRRPF